MNDQNMIYSIETFNKEFANEFSDLKVIHLNIVSLNKNHAQLECFLSSLTIQFDVIILSEIRNINLNLFSNIFSDMEFIFMTSATSVVGGIGIYVKKSFSYIHRVDLQINNCETESVFLELKSKKKNTVIGGVYRHPRDNFDVFAKTFQRLCDVINDENKYFICMGDFNINLLNKKIKKIYEYELDLNLLSITQLIKGPTRENDDSATLIDHIYVNNSNMYHVGILHASISDHYPIFLLSKQNLQLKSGRPFVRIYAKNAMNDF